jgi:mannose-6-phosphate isomerase-like protein (cupin superfamily)
MLATTSLPRWHVTKTFAVSAIAALLWGCRAVSTGSAIPQQALAGPRPAVIGAHEGERRFLRGGTAPLLIKIDPVTTGSRRMVLGSSDLPPGDAIGVHRHLREDEILLVTRGTARVHLGTKLFTADPGATVFIPQGTCIAVENVGTDTLTNIFIFSSPGFEQVMRDVSSPEGAPPKRVSPDERAAAFHRGHAEAGPKDC